MRRRQLPFTVALLLFFYQCQSRVTPRVSFPIGSPERRLTFFSSPDVSNTTSLLLSEDEDTLYVGAQDVVLALDVTHKEAFLVKRKLEWSPSQKDIEQCSMKGKKMVDCPNFIRVLEFLNSTHIYACGTFAFSPRCTYIDMETLTMSDRSDEGRGRCPYDPYQRNTAIVVDGELYTGTVADYRGNRPVISRHLSEGQRVDLKLDDTLGWLEDPTFISSIFVPDEEKIYFFFSEVGREYDFIDKFIVSRVSQICTSDVGGQRTLQRRWTTFAKAQLLCQADSELPYNVIQDITILPPTEGAPSDNMLFFGIFTSQWAVNSGQSAICSFSLSDIKSVFSGNYKVLNRDTLQWSSRVQEKIANPGECGLHNASDNALRFIKENFLADDSVRPVERALTLVSEHNYSHLTVQRVQAAHGTNYTLLFLLTVTGYLHKAVLLQSSVHIIEELQVFERPQTVTSMKLSLSKGMIYIGTSEGVVRFPTANCSFYWTCAQCVLSRDPFCGWDMGRRACVVVTNSQTTLAQDIEKGNTEEVCTSGSLIHRAEFGPKKIPTALCPPGVLVSISLNEVVRLHCPAASRLSRQMWERPNSRLSPDLYLLLEDGSLSFVATPATLGHYLCLSVENGYQQTMAVYQVKQNSSPIVPQTSSSSLMQSAFTTQPFPKTEQRTENRLQNSKPTLSISSTKPLSRVIPVQTDKDFRNENKLLAPGGRCYLKELVIVTVLLVLCLSLLLTLLMYVFRQRCHNQTAPQPATPTRLSERRSPVEHEAQQDRHKLIQHNGHSGGSGLNGHLPNVPV